MITFKNSNNSIENDSKLRRLNLEIETSHQNIDESELAGLYFERAQVHTDRGHLSLAYNDYKTCLSHDPCSTEAMKAKEKVSYNRGIRTIGFNQISA